MRRGGVNPRRAKLNQVVPKKPYVNYRKELRPSVIDRHNQRKRMVWATPPPRPPPPPKVRGVQVHLQSVMQNFEMPLIHIISEDALEITDPCEIPNRLGIPLLAVKFQESKESKRVIFKHPNARNATAANMMMKFEEGDIPDEWANVPRDVFFYRKDFKPLNLCQMKVLNEFNKAKLGPLYKKCAKKGPNSYAKAHDLINKEEWGTFWEKCKKKGISGGYKNVSVKCKRTFGDELEKRWVRFKYEFADLPPPKKYRAGTNPIKVRQGNLVTDWERAVNPVDV